MSWSIRSGSGKDLGAVLAPRALSDTLQTATDDVERAAWTPD